jgi:hypothetical protein
MLSQTADKHYLYCMNWLFLFIGLWALEPGVEFTSEYFYLDKATCQEVPTENEGSDAPDVCLALDGYEVYTYYNLYGHGIKSLTNEHGFDCSLTGSDCTDSQDYGNVIEWRKADGQYFAVIMRYKCLALAEATDEETGVTYEIFEVTSEQLLVKGLAGYEHIDQVVDIQSTKNANTVARKIADKGYLEK